VDDDQNLVGLLTQSYFIQFLSQNLNHASGPICDKTVHELEIISKGLADQIPYTSNAIDAYHEIFIQRLSSIPIVDEHSKFITSLSVSDLRGLSEDNIQNLVLPVLEFKEKHKKVAITITANALFETVVMKLATNAVHRLYVVDSVGTLKGVVALTDICKALAKLIE